MDQRNNDIGVQRAGAANTPPTAETERELERTRDVVAEAAAPVMAEKTQEAVKETADRLQRDPEVREQVKRTAEAATHDAQRMASEKVDEVKQRAESRVNEQKDRAAGRLDDVAYRIDEAADRAAGGAGGARARAGEMAHRAADGLHGAADYLRKNDLGDFRTTLEREMRERPLQTLLMGVAAGWVVGKIVR